jgi:alpha-galactosidase
MTRIVLVGAGSVVFTRTLLTDILARPRLSDVSIALHDIDGERLRTAERLATWLAGALGASPRVEAHLDRRAALRGADVVINTVQVGGARATQLDFDVPARYGLRYAINDTINVGGVMRGLRSIPVALDIARDMADLCPDAWLLNYTNPMAMLVRAVAEQGGVRVVGLCHAVTNTVATIAGYLDLPADEVDHVSAGVNHLAFMLRLEHRGRDLYPELRDFVEAGRVPPDDLVRAELFRRFGRYPTESSEHHAEYNPWFIPKGDMVERFNVPIGEYLRRVASHLDEHEETRRRLDAGLPFEVGTSREVAADIIGSLVTGTPSRVVGNVVNHGGLVGGLPEDACVEVPCLVDGTGVWPVRVGAMPPACAAYQGPAVATQALTVRALLDEDPGLVVHAVLQDPMVQAGLTLDQAWRMTGELIAAQAEWLPAWLRA